MSTNPAYAVACLRKVEPGPQIEEYMRRIDDTVTDYNGRFVIHGGHRTPLEGTWDGDIIRIAFPSLRAATAW